MEHYHEGDAVQALRRLRVLPSDLLDMARQNNPDLEIDLDDRSTSKPEPITLRVKTGRGTLVYHRGPRETWHEVFVRAELLGR